MEFAGSVSLRLYPHNELEAPAIVDELRGQARLATDSGFDGVMTSEHHGGFAGYLPNPLQAAGWLLETMPAGWAAACPLLLPLRPPALVAEEVAWLAARFPDRVGLGVASGALPTDFETMHVPMDDLAPRFGAALEEVVSLLRGDRAIGDDAAIARCRAHPVPVLSAAMGFTAVRRAARVGAGLLFDSLSAPERVRQLVDAYRAAGGDGSCVLIRRAWVGAPPRALVERQVDVYRSYSPETAQRGWTGDQLAGEPLEVAEELRAVAGASGADALNLRVHFPGVAPHDVREQIIRLGTEVVPALELP